jgi:hypothetical protein
VIQNICHYECRQQLIGYTALHYWLAPLFSEFGSIFDEIGELLCCGGTRQGLKQRVVPTNMDAQNVTTAGFTNAAMFTRILNSFVTNKMGATMINAINPNVQAVDLRTYVGQPLENTQGPLAQQGFTALDIQQVDADPAWDATTVSANSQFAPSVATAGQPLTLYVKGKSVVGIEVTDPTRALQLQVRNLASTVSALQTQLANMSPASPASSTEKKQ